MQPHQNWGGKQIKKLTMNVTFTGAYGDISSQFPTNGNKVPISASGNVGVGLVPFKSPEGKWFLGIVNSTRNTTDAIDIFYIEL